MFLVTIALIFTDQSRALYESVLHGAIVLRSDAFKHFCKFALVVLAVPYVLACEIAHHTPVLYFIQPDTIGPEFLGHVYHVVHLVVVVLLHNEVQGEFEV